MELFYPEIGVQIGPYAIKKGIQLEVMSAADTYFDWARVRFTKPYSGQIQAAKGDEASVYLGYDGVLDEVFRGYVFQAYNQAAGQDEILLKDAMQRIEAVTVTETFLDVIPQEIVRHVLALAGIEAYELSGQIYQPKKVVPIQQKNGIQVLDGLAVLWGIRHRYFFSGGVFYWGTEPKQETVYRFLYGVNIISLKRSGGSWELETMSAPFVRHSHKIFVEHPDYTGEAKVKKVVFQTNDAGFIRTYITF